MFLASNAFHCDGMLQEIVEAPPITEADRDHLAKLSNRALFAIASQMNLHLEDPNENPADAISRVVNEKSRQIRLAQNPRQQRSQIQQEFQDESASLSSQHQNTDFEGLVSFFF